MKHPVLTDDTYMAVVPDTSKKIMMNTTLMVCIVPTCVVLFSSQPFLHSKYLHCILACKQYLDEFDLPDAYDVPGNNLPGSQKQTHTVNSVNNSDHAGDGPGSLDYDMDSSLMGYYPLVVSFNFILLLSALEVNSITPSSKLFLNYFFLEITTI